MAVYQYYTNMIVVPMVIILCSVLQRVALSTPYEFSIVLVGSRVGGPRPLLPPFRGGGIFIGRGPQRAATGTDGRGHYIRRMYIVKKVPAKPVPPMPPPPIPPPPPPPSGALLVDLILSKI